MGKEFEIFKNSRTDTIYISPGFPKYRTEQEFKEVIFRGVPLSFEAWQKKTYINYVKKASTFMETENQYGFIKEKDKIILRKTQGGKQEIQAKYLESEKDVFVLTIQKYTSVTGSPHKQYFSFVNDEIKELKTFLDSIPFLPNSGKKSDKIKESEIKKIIQTKEYLENHKELIQEIIGSDITQTDIAVIKHRKQQLEVFRKMLDEDRYFQFLLDKKNKTSKESLWQEFFEKNDWIFGYGLSYIFSSSLDDKKLEQVVSGFSFNERGKRIDALLKTRGLINLLCFAEIKHHKTKLLDNKPYRADCWSISNELAGAVAQIQKSSQKAIQKIGEEIRIRDNMGNPTGETSYMYQPKSFLVIGNLDEFKAENGVNKEKLGSFELYRQNTMNPEIITFDELYHRAKFIVESKEE